MKKLIIKNLNELDCTILVFEPSSSTNIEMSKEINDLLLENSIEKILPNDRLYPEKIKGRSSKEIFYKGNLELLDKKNISLIVTSKPEEREKKALQSFIDELPNNDFVFLLGFSNSYEIDLVKIILERGFKTVLILPFGILKLKIRKDLENIWNMENILIASVSEPNKTWKSYESINALKFRMKISDLLLINSLHFDKLEKLENDLISLKNKKFYLNYWKDYNDFFVKISADKIGLNPKTKKPNTIKILNYLKEK